MYNLLHNTPVSYTFQIHFLNGYIPIPPGFCYLYPLLRYITMRRTLLAPTYPKWNADDEGSR